MAALVAALALQASDRAPWLAARLAATGKAAPVLVAVLLSAVLAQGLGAAAGSLLAPMLTANARALLLGLALLSAAWGAFLQVKPVTGPPRGAVASTILLLAGAMGDRTQFVTLAIAARDDLPVFAAIGAVIGVVAVQGAAVLAGWTPPAAPMRALRAGIGGVLAIIGGWTALAALRLT
ncbi:MAG: TMEM165/GDT1 family protein [Sphingomonas sp.]